MRRLPLACCLLLSALTVPVHAQSDEDPWYLGAGLGLTRVHNLYREAGGGSDDDVRSLTLLAGAQARLGRQRFKLDTRFNQNDYRRNTQLRYLGYSANAGWEWSSGTQLSGELRLGSQRQLAPYAAGSAKNLQRDDRAHLGLRYGLSGPWSVDGNLHASRRDYSLAVYDPYDYTQQSADLGVRWQPSAALQLRLATRQTQGRYPRYRVQSDGSVLADRFERQDLDAVLQWQPSGVHRLVLRLSDGHSRFTEAAARDFKGRTGGLDWTWTPVSRFVLQAQLTREHGDDARALELGQFGTLNLNDGRRYTSTQLQASYALTGKLTLDGSLYQLQRDLSSRTGALVQTGTDRTRAASLGLRWAFDRHGQLGCQIGSDRRSQATGFSQPYRASSLGCSAQLLLR